MRLSVMGILFTEDDDGAYVDSVVFFLGEALRTAIEVGDGLQQAACEVPQLKSGMNCNEMAESLAAFRKRTQALWSQEVLMVAKIMRARELAKELRSLNHELRPEIETFRLATTSAPDLQDMLLPNAEYYFNGSAQPKRFLNQRGHGAAGTSGVTDPVAGYKISGVTDVRLLLTACETLHFGLAAHYGFDTLPSRSQIDAAAEEPLLLEMEEDDALPMPAVADNAMLLTELGDMLAETPMSQWIAQQEQQNKVTQPVLAN